MGMYLILWLPHPIHQAHNMSGPLTHATLWNYSSCCTELSCSSFYSPTSAAGSTASWRHGGNIQGVRAIYAQLEMQTLPSGLTLPALVSGLLRCSSSPNLPGKKSSINQALHALLFSVHMFIPKGTQSKCNHIIFAYAFSCADPALNY